MSAEQMSLESILSDEKPVAAPEAAPEPVKDDGAIDTPPPEAPVEKPKSLRKQHREREEAARAEGEGKVRGEDGKFVAKEAAKVEAPAPVVEPVKPAAQPAQDMTDKEKAFLRAAQEERTKRQELERRLAALEKPAEPEKQFWDDPEGALKKMEARIEGVAVNTRLNTAETIARSKYPDFDEKVAVFAQVLHQTPGLHPQWLNSPDPAEFAYRTAKNYQEIQQVGSIDAMRKKIETDVAARVRAEVEAEYKAKADASAKERAALPGSLGDTRGGTNPSRPVWSGPTPLDQILKG